MSVEKVIGFAVTTLYDWLNLLRKQKPIMIRLQRFPRIASATCNYFEFLHINVLNNTMFVFSDFISLVQDKKKIATTSNGGREFPQIESEVEILS